MSDPTPPAVSDAVREAVARVVWGPYDTARQIDAICATFASEIARLTGELEAETAVLTAECKVYRGLAEKYAAAAEAAEAETARLRADAERFRALMRCGRIKPQGSAGVNSKTGERTYPDQPGSVHFGAEFWVEPEAEPSNMTIWGRHCLHALADDILAFEARAALTSQEKTDA